MVKNLEITEVSIFVHGQHVVAWCHQTYSCKRKGKGSKKNRNMVVYGVILTKFRQSFKLGWERRKVALFCKRQKNKLILLEVCAETAKKISWSVAQFITQAVILLPLSHYLCRVYFFFPPTETKVKTCCKVSVRCETWESAVVSWI